MCFSTIDTNRLKPINIKLPAKIRNVAKPCRPYTEYNLFFQLEREHILQIQLGFQPEYEPEDIFDPFDSSNYQGPPLPSRYNGLLLLSDWHLPGKEKRRKRRHRKTHGMIGFQELSLRIADSWKNVDADTRTYCAELCDMGLMQYKKAMRAYKAAHPEEIRETLSIKTSDDDNKKIAAARASICLTAAENELNPFLFDITTSHARYIPTERCSMAEVDAAFENDLALSLETFNGSIISNITATSTDRCSLGSRTDSMVDIEDDEIISMWKSTVETDDEASFACTAGTVVSNISRSPSQVSSPDNIEDQTITSASFDPYGQNSQIDATMNDLKKLRKALLNQQVQMQSSITAAMYLSNGLINKNQSQKTKYGFAARSA